MHNVLCILSYITLCKPLVRWDLTKKNKKAKASSAHVPTGTCVCILYQGSRKHEHRLTRLVSSRANNPGAIVGSSPPLWYWDMTLDQCREKRYLEAMFQLSIWKTVGAFPCAMGMQSCAYWIGQAPVAPIFNNFYFAHQNAIFCWFMELWNSDVFFVKLACCWICFMCNGDAKLCRLGWANACRGRFQWYLILHIRMCRTGQTKHIICMYMYMRM